MDRLNVVSLNEVVHDYLLQNDLNTDSYLKIKSFAIRLLTRLNLTTLRNIVVAELYPDQINTVLLPPDFISEEKVGLSVRGEIFLLSKDDNIKNPDLMSCGVMQRDTTEEKIYFNPIYLHGEYRHFYGIHDSRTKVRYRIDHIRNRMTLKGELPVGEPLYLEYISSGVEPTGNTVIPLIAEDCMQHGLAWLMSPRDQILLANFEKSEIELRNQRFQFTWKEMQDAFNNTISRAVVR